MPVQPPPPPKPPKGDQGDYMKTILDHELMTNEQKVDLLKKWIE